LNPIGCSDSIFPALFSNPFIDVFEDGLNDGWQLSSKYAWTPRSR